MGSEIRGAQTYRMSCLQATSLSYAAISQRHNSIVLHCRLATAATVISKLGAGQTTKAAVPVVHAGDEGEDLDAADTSTLPLPSDAK